MIQLCTKSSIRLRGFIPDYPRRIIYIIADSMPEDTLENFSNRFSSALFMMEGIDWDRQLSPWPAPAVFKGQKDFSGGADAFLSCIENETLPEAEKTFSAPLPRSLCGVSLGGLFALYAACHCPLFSSVASISGSLWYDGMISFLQSRPPAQEVKRIYLSLGAKEKNARNKRMATVEDATKEAYQLFSSRGIDTKFEINPGGHFTDPAGRLEKALSFLSSFSPRHV